MEDMNDDEKREKLRILTLQSKAAQDQLVSLMSELNEQEISRLNELAQTILMEPEAIPEGVRSAMTAIYSIGTSVLVLARGERREE